MLARIKVPEGLKDIIDIPMEDVLEYQALEQEPVLLIPLKVPMENQKFMAQCKTLWDFGFRTYDARLKSMIFRNRYSSSAMP